MFYDISKVAFSYPGSYYALSYLEASDEEPAGLYLRTLHKDVYRSKIARFTIAGADSPLVYQATATSLTLRTEQGEAVIIFNDADSLICKVQGTQLTIEFVKAAQAIPYNINECEINCDGQREKVRIIAITGGMVLDTNWNGDNADYVQVCLTPEPDEQEMTGVVHLVRDRISYPEQTYPLFQERLIYNETLFHNYLQAAPAVPEAFWETRALASYMNWSSVVKPYGQIKRPTMYSSKNGMAGIWSWDHCFHAMVMSSHDPEMAWDQWMLFFDHQDEDGALPDTLTDTYMGRGYVKPPVHGWALKWLMEHAHFITDRHLAEAYDPLSKWTDFWFTRRDMDQNGIPEYHNGNDSGWDNSTMFCEGVPLEGPDLSTYLIIQMDTLAEMAERLGKKEEAHQWQQRSTNLLDDMLSHFVVDHRFSARRPGVTQPVSSKSLLLYIPLLLGNKLPLEVREHMVSDLRTEGKFLTRYGWASEELDSEFYTTDGYWRGPIWAPPTFILITALRSIGEHALATDMTERFCRLCSMSGMAENFNALTGEALRDPAIVWTSSVFLLLGSQL